MYLVVDSFSLPQEDKLPKSRDSSLTDVAQDTYRELYEYWLNGNLLHENE